MKKILLALFIPIFFITSVAYSAPLALPSKPAGLMITASSVFMMEETQGKVLFQKRENKRGQAASTIKVLTALVVSETLPMDRMVTVPEGVGAIEPSRVNLKAGERYTIGSLLKAVLLASANDAAYALSIVTGENQANFCKLMNQKAKRIGATESNFTTPHGLPDARQYTTTRDLTLIMQAAEKNPALVSIMRQKTAVIYSEAGRKIVLRNHNKLLWRDPRDIIGKTGWTRSARHCFVGRMVYAKKVFLFAIMGSVRPWQDLKILLNAFTRAPSIAKKKDGKKADTAAITDKKKIQAALKKAGFYSGPIDGKIGTQTKKAIKAFQKKNKLKPTGNLGPATQKALAQYF